MTNILNIKAFPTIINAANIPVWVITYQADYASSQTGQVGAIDGKGTTNVGTSPYPTYSDFLTAVTALQNAADVNNPSITDICGGILSRTNVDAVGQGATGNFFSNYAIEIVDAPIESQIQKDILDAMPETMTGTTNSSGDVTFTYAKTYTSLPKLFPSVQQLATVDSAHNTSHCITNESLTGCTIRGMKGVNTSVVLLNTAVDPDTIVPTGTAINLIVFK